MSISSAVNDSQYWEQFSVTPSDLNYLANFLVENEEPYTLSQLAYELTRYRRQRLINLAQETLAQGRIYRPGEAYEVGETLVFPHLNNLVAEVQEVRAGVNPEYEPFSVIGVRTAGGRQREFVSDLTQEHPLNTASYLPAEDMSPEEIFARYGTDITAQLQGAMETSSQFVNVAHKWFLRELLVEIPPGQLNIAEALLDMNEGGPLRTEAFLAEMELPEEISRPLQLFSLEYALLRDRRFDEVGPAGYALWYLRALEPKSVLETPPQLRYMPIPYNRGVLDEVMLSLERQARDEWSETATMDVTTDRITIVLAYPHWRSGTLPLAPHVANLFPSARITDRIRFTFVDGLTGDEFPGWVVRSGRYVYGLQEWYQEYDVGVGSFIDLEHAEEKGKIAVRVRPIRSRRREWLRTVTVSGEDLIFEVTRVPVSCEYDELAAVAVPDPEAIDALSPVFQRASLESLLEHAFNGLAGLSLQRAVHAMTLYSVLNLMRRVPPAPMLATLAVASKYISLGDNYWAYRGEA